MGIIDRVVEQYSTKEVVKLEELTEVLKKNLDAKFKITFQPKASVAKQILGGSKMDNVLVIKNAYHRARVSVTDHKDPTTSEVEYYFHFDDSEISPVLRFISRELSFLGGPILSAIYGKDTLYDDVFNIIMKEYKTETKEHQIGLKALFGKK